jgi:hypothetical protein
VKAQPSLHPSNKGDISHETLEVCDDAASTAPQPAIIQVSVQLYYCINNNRHTCSQTNLIPENSVGTVVDLRVE